MFKYLIEITFEENGVIIHKSVEFKNIDLAVSHLISAMDCGYTVTFKSNNAPNEN